ncbi:MAG TPA: hypothetical protein VJN22_01615 [Candidatus Eremiobacteraceae bacterium]|nr:hypothetical protein [Candidatus Eremiobacteraceae bacterium]
MSRAGRKPTADMLLVEARRRRLLALRTNPHAAPSEVLVADEDAIIVDYSHDRESLGPATFDHDRTATNKDVLHCYRPLSAVTLARLAWSGTIDHVLLHEAVGCAPLDPGMSAPNLVRCAAASAIRGAPAAEPALYVGIGEDDVAALESALEGAEADCGSRLATAALLPEALIGAPARAEYAAAQALTAYRGAALVSAWREIMGAPDLPEVTRERDSAAVRLLSTLRALLGEA